MKIPPRKVIKFRPYGRGRIAPRPQKHLYTCPKFPSAPSRCRPPRYANSSRWPTRPAPGATKIYHLNIGQPDLPSPKEGLESLKHIDRKVLEYSPSDGYRSLREKLVTYYEQYQIKLSPEEIIVTTGGSEAVLFAFMSCLNPGDEIIVPEPAYANYMAFAISAGAVIRPGGGLHRERIRAAARSRSSRS